MSVSLAVWLLARSLTRSPACLLIHWLALCHTLSFRACTRWNQLTVIGIHTSYNREALILSLFTPHTKTNSTGRVRATMHMPTDQCVCVCLLSLSETKRISQISCSWFANAIDSLINESLNTMDRNQGKVDCNNGECDKNQTIVFNWTVEHVCVFAHLRVPDHLVSNGRRNCAIAHCCRHLKAITYVWFIQLNDYGSAWKLHCRTVFVNCGSKCDEKSICFGKLFWTSQKKTSTEKCSHIGTHTHTT